MKLCFKLVVVCLAVGLVVWKVLSNAESHAPVEQGTAIEFWYFACGVDVSDDNSPKTFGAIYPPQGESGVYYVQGYHGQFIHEAPLADLARYLPEVLEKLDSRRKTGDLPAFLEQALDAAEDSGSEPNDVRRFLVAVRENRLAALRKDDPAHFEYVLATERDFEERWKRADYYWATLLFECVWLGGLVVFISIPWLLCARLLTWSILISMVPPLLILPHFLGYVPDVFTSAFPAGGVFYPYTVIGFRVLPWTELDTWLVQILPQPFEPLSQSRGPMLASTGLGRGGPMSVLFLGIILGGAVYGAGIVWRQFRATLTDRLLRQRATHTDGAEHDANAE